jgi:hypothetical protein
MTPELDRGQAEGIKDEVKHEGLPAGFTVLPNREVNPENIKKLAQVLASIVAPAQRDIIKKAFDLE